MRTATTDKEAQASTLPIRRASQRPLTAVQAKRRTWLSRLSILSLPLVLGIALLVGVVYLYAVPPWQGPDEPSHFAYVGLLYRHNLDDRAVSALDPGTDWRQADHALLVAVTASMQRNNFAGFVPNYGAAGSVLGDNYAMFQEMRQPAPYYWLCAAALHAMGFLGIHADPYINTETALLVARWVSLLLSLGVVALGWAAGALISSRPALRLAIPLVIVLLPQHAFLMPLVNNDVLANLVVAGLFVTLLALLTRPLGRRGLVLALLAVVLAVATLLTKGTATSAALPLLALGLLVWLGTLLARWAHNRGGPLNRVPILPALFLLALAGGVGLLLLTTGPRSSEAAAWAIGQADNRPVQRVSAPDALQGSSVMEVQAEGEGAAAVQVLVPPLYHPGMRFSVTAWVRRPPGDTRPDTRTAALLLYTGAQRIEGDRVLLDKPEQWQKIELTAVSPESAGAVTIKLEAEGGGGAVQFDHVEAQMQWTGNYWLQPFYSARLINGSAESPVYGFRPPFDRLVPLEVRQMAQTALNPQQYDVGELAGFFALAQYRSFWGDFGWLYLSLPDGLYFCLGIVAAIALAGLVLRGVRLLGRWSAFEWMGLISLLALAITVGTGFLRQMMLVTFYSITAPPQGRYLFVLLIPFAWLLAAGLWEMWRLFLGGLRSLYHMARRRSPRQRTRSTAGVGDLWATGAFAAALFALQAYSLFALILPYYRR